jgi:DNA-binding MarR family transcriptional regulator
VPSTQFNPAVPLKQVHHLADFRFRLRTFLSFSEQAADAAGITAQHYQLLQILALDDPRGVAITEIAQRMLLRHNSAVELIDRAERARLVLRTPDQDDHRRALILLTPRGRTLLARLVTEHLAYLRQDGPALVQALERVIVGGS